MPIEYGWHFGANDNTRGGWLIFLVYLILAIWCWREVAQYRTTVRGRRLSLRFWLGLSLFVTVLAVNKQLDFQTLLIEMARRAATVEGIINYSRWINGAFVVLSGCIGVFVARRLWKLSRYATKPERLVLMGTAALTGFVLFRTASINHVELLGEVVERHRPLVVLELLILIFLGFAVFKRADPQS